MKAEDSPPFATNPRRILYVVLCCAVLAFALLWRSRPSTETPLGAGLVRLDDVSTPNGSSAGDTFASMASMARLEDVDASVGAADLSRLDGLLRDLTRVFNAQLPTDHRYQEYLDCVERLSADDQTCRALRSAAFFFVLDVSVFPELIERRDLLRDLIAQIGEDALVGNLAARLSSAEDEGARLVLLTVATFDQVFSPREFPPDAYARLDELSVPEQTMLMSPHETLAIEDSEIVRRVAAISIAPDTDGRTRRASIKALGHPNTAEEFERTMEELRANPAILQGAWLQVGQALGRCGPNCVGTVEALAGGTRLERRIAYEAVLTADPNQAQAFQEALVRAGEPTDQDEEERRMRDHAIHLGGH